MASSAEVNITPEGDNSGEIHDRPLADKVRNPMMEQYDRVLRENSERVRERREGGIPQTQTTGGNDYKEAAKNFLRNRMEEDINGTATNKTEQVILSEEMTEDQAREEAKRRLASQGIDINRIASRLKKEDVPGAQEGVVSGTESVVVEPIIDLEKDNLQSDAVSEVSTDNKEVEDPKEDFEVVENITPILEEDDLFVKFESVRSRLAKAEVAAKREKRDLNSLEKVLEQQYKGLREKIAEDIRTKKREALNVATDEEVFGKELKDEIFQKLVVEENAKYIKALKEARGETWKDKLKEGARDLLGTKTVQWYLGQDKYKRLAINTLLFSTAIGLGTFATTGMATAAAGAFSLRMARGAMSFAGAEVGRRLGDKGLEIKGKKIWMSPEEIDSWQKEEESKIRDSEGSLEEKSNKLKEIQEEASRQRSKTAKYKAGLTVGLGAGAGIGTGVGVGMLDHYYSGSGSNVAEHIDKPKVTPSESTDLPEALQPEVQGGVVKEATHLTESGEAVETPEIIAGKILGDPSAINQTVPKGGSFWGITKSALEHNNRFQALSSGQKNNIIAYYTNKGILKPEEYDLTSDPNPRYGIKLEPEQEVNLSKLFSDEAEFEKVIKRAENLSPKVIEQMEKRTIAYENFYKANPGKVLTPKEILNIEEMPEANLVQEVASIEKPKSAMEQEFFAPKKPDELLAENDIDSASYNDPTNLHKDIQAAKARLAELENSPVAKPKVVQMPSRQSMPEPALVRTMQGDTNNLIKMVNNKVVESALSDPVEKAFANEVQTVYGSEGFMGIGKVPGLSSKEWGLMKGLNAGEVVKYFTGDSEQTLLPAKVATELAKSAKHKAFSEQLLGLIDVTEGNVKPYENETVEKFLKRLGEFVMKKHTEGTSNIKMAA